MSGKGRADLRLVVQEGERLALAWQASIYGADVYAGPPATEQGEVFRFSYHESGATHFYIGRHRLPPGAPSSPLRRLVGWERLAAWSVSPLAWGYTPKPNTPRRFNLIVDISLVPIPVTSWTVGLIAAERGRRELVEQV